MQDLSVERIKLLQKCEKLQDEIRHKFIRDVAVKCRHYCSRCYSTDIIQKNGFRDLCNSCKYRASDEENGRFKTILFILEHQHREILGEKYYLTLDEYVTGKWNVQLFDRKNPAVMEEEFECETLEQALDMACEFVLSEGKNDLREE